MKRLGYLLCLILALASCDGSKRAVPEGERISVLQTQSTPLETTSSHRFVPARAVQVLDWPQNNYNSENLMPVADIKPPFKQVYEVSGGRSFDNTSYTMARPVVLNETVYTIDAKLSVQAYQVSTGQKRWRTSLQSHNETAVKGTGLAVTSDCVFATLGRGAVYALSPTDGHILWQVDMNEAIRTAPTVKNGRVFILSATNKLTVLEAKTGKTLWTYQALKSKASLFGMAQPAVSGAIVVVAFSSGEVTAFQVSDGSIIWSHMLLPERRFSAIGELTHITAAPVIAKGTVFVFSASSKMAAYDLKSGQPKFTKNMGALKTPLISGNALFVLSENKLVSLSLQDGGVFWETSLPETEEEDGFWLTPFLAGDTVALTHSSGKIYFINTKTGALTDVLEIQKPAASPVTAANGLMIWTRDARLSLYKG